MSSKLILALAAVAGLAAATLPALAEDVIEDGIDCSELWVMRNEIYKDNGYCFKTAKAKNYFGNGGCQYDSEGDIPLSGQDRRKIRKFKQAEARQGC